MTSSPGTVTYRQLRSPSVHTFPPDRDGRYRAICLDGPLRGEEVNCRQPWFRAPADPQPMHPTVLHLVANEPAVLRQDIRIVEYTWSSHWTYSHFETENGGIQFTQMREPAWRCGES